MPGKSKGVRLHNALITQAMAAMRLRRLTWGQISLRFKSDRHNTKRRVKKWLKEGQQCSFYKELP